MQPHEMWVRIRGHQAEVQETRESVHVEDGSSDCSLCDDEDCYHRGQNCEKGSDESTPLFWRQFVGPILKDGMLTRQPMRGKGMLVTK